MRSVVVVTPIAAMAGAMLLVHARAAGGTLAVGAGPAAGTIMPLAGPVPAVVPMALAMLSALLSGTVMALRRRLGGGGGRGDGERENRAEQIFHRSVS